MKRAPRPAMIAPISMPLRASRLAAVVVVVAVGAGAALPRCPFDDDGAADAGPRSADAPRDAGPATSSAPAPLPADPASFRFARWGKGREVIRIGLDERVRTVDGVPDSRSAPTSEQLVKLVAACAEPALASARQEPAPAPAAAAPPSDGGVPGSSQGDEVVEVLELGCAPGGGVFACTARRPCTEAFARVRSLVQAIYDEPDATPKRGLDVRQRRWLTGADAGAAGVGLAEANLNVVLSVGGRPQLPTKPPFARAPAGEVSRLCTSVNTCVDVVAPALVHLDVIGAEQRWRCDRCTLPTPRTTLQPVPQLAAGEQTKAEIINVLRPALDKVRAKCAAKAGPEIVVVELRVGARGTVGAVKERGARPSLRGKCAVGILRNLRFEPTMTNQAVPVAVPIRFPSSP